MTDDQPESTEGRRRKLAEAFDRPIDPLAEAGAVFEATDVDPFALYRTEVLAEKNLTRATHRNFQSLFEEWQQFMADQGRHPACPNPSHVEAYIEWQTSPEADGGRDNTNRTVKEKLRKLNQAYSYWQQDAAFPHPDGYNPIQVARERTPLPVKKEKEHRRVPLDELREIVGSVTHLRSLTLIAMQLKLGLRAGEVANMRLQDVHLPDSTAHEHLSAMGTHDRLDGYTNVLYVPSKFERDGNKSSRPRLLPLDADVRRLLDRYLLVRPDTGEPWLFLSKKSHTQLTSKGVNKIWKDEFHPEYAETTDHRPITSHFGRHRFTTYWRVEQDVNRQLVKYMRGDRTGAYRNDRGMNAYLHAYYEDIEDLYRKNVFRFSLGEA